MSEQLLMMGNIEDEAVCYADGTVAHRMRRDGNPEFDLQELRTITKCWNTHDTLTKQRDDLLAVCEVFVDEVFDDKELWDIISNRGEKYEIWLCGIIEQTKSAIAAAKT